MKTALRISRLLQIGLLMTFLLPFFPQGCDPKPASAVSEQSIDTVSVTTDSIQQNNMVLATQVEEKDTTKTAVTKNTTENNNELEETNDDSTLSTKIAHKSKLLKLVLRPNNNYTGIASVIDFFLF